MEKYTINLLKNSEYLGIVTILDYEIKLNEYLSHLVFPSDFKDKKAIVDLALMVGLNKFRFVSFDVDDNGKLVLNTNNYANVPKEVEKLANCFLREKSEIVNNSFLTERQKKQVLYNN